MVAPTPPRFARRPSPAERGRAQSVVVLVLVPFVVLVFVGTALGSLETPQSRGDSRGGRASAVSGRREIRGGKLREEPLSHIQMTWNVLPVGVRHPPLGGGTTSLPWVRHPVAEEGRRPGAPPAPWTVHEFRRFSGDECRRRGSSDLRRRRTAPKRRIVTLRARAIYRGNSGRPICRWGCGIPPWQYVPCHSGRATTARRRRPSRARSIRSARTPRGEAKGFGGFHILRQHGRRGACVSASFCSAVRSGAAARPRRVSASLSATPPALRLSYALPARASSPGARRHPRDDGREPDERNSVWSFDASTVAYRSPGGSDAGGANLSMDGASGGATASHGWGGRTARARVRSLGRAR